jgi:hypothetical protein
LEVTAGFEPAQDGFANRSLSHLGTSPFKSNWLVALWLTSQPLGCQFENNIQRKLWSLQLSGITLRVAQIPRLVYEVAAGSELGADLPGCVLQGAAEQCLQSSRGRACEAWPETAIFAPDLIISLAHL